jgi:hypothetical protein
MLLAFDLDRYVAQIRAFEGERFAVASEATMPHCGRAHPVLSVRSRAVASKTLLVLAGVHGDERAGILAVPQILEAWSSERVRLVVITPVNPVGAARNSRVNASGHDINRDFIRFATAEARVVRDVFERERPDFVISLHEASQEGTFMFVNRFVDHAFARDLCHVLAAGGTALAKRDYFGRRLDPPGLAPASLTTRAAWKLAAALRRKATIAYSEDRSVPEIVLESSSRRADEVARLRPHVDLVAAVAERVTGWVG